jgi:O-antigen/teichoic acid export membrane protein
MLSKLVSSGLAFVGLLFITRYLGAEVLGTISWTLALIATFNVISDLGLNSAHIKRVSEGKDINDCVSTFIVSKLLLTSLMVVSVIASVLVWTNVLGQPLTETSMSLIGLFILSIVFFDIAQIATVTYNARMEIAKSQISSVIEILVRVPLIVFVAINRMSDIALAYAYVLGALGFAIVALFLLSRERIEWKRPTLFRSYMAFAIPISTILIMGALANNIDKLLIGGFWNAELVGYYTGSKSLLMIFAIFGTAAATLAFPAFSKMHSEGNMDMVRRGTLEAEKYVSMFTLPIIAVIVLFPTGVATVLLGGGFAQSGDSLRFLAISTFFTLLIGIYSSQIYAINRQELTAKLTFVSLVILLILLIILVPSSLGGIELPGLADMGAAIANMTYFAIMFVSFRYLIARLTGTAFRWKLLTHLIAAILCGIGVTILSNYWPLDDWISLIGYGIISMAIFFPTLWLLRELKSSDVRYLLRAVDPRQMGDYIISEFKKKE